MAKGISRTALIALALVGLTCLAATAQNQPVPIVPDAYVRGNGAITVPPDPNSPSNQKNLGIFGINVARANGVLYGGFNYTEVTPTGVRVAVIVSKELISMDIFGNRALIRAKGMYNRIPACLTLEVEDNIASPVAKPDWLHITADGCMMPVIYYNKAGDVVRGDIVVWEKPPGYGYAKGCGAIGVPKPEGIPPNIGSFYFRGENTSAGPVGMICYTEFNPVATAISRPAVQIYVPKLSAMRVEKNRAVLEGPGTLNGKPAFVSVLGVDNAGLRCDGDRCPDWFAITAKLTNADGNVPDYHAEGPLIKGDIVVGSY